MGYYFTTNGSYCDLNWKILLQDDLKIQTVNVKKQLDDTYEVQNKNEAKISSMVQCIRQLNEEKGTLEMHLDQKESSLMNEVIEREYLFLIMKCVRLLRF